jgi:hypothetical protein
MLNDLIEQIGIFPPGSQQRIGRRLGNWFRLRLLLVEPLNQQGCRYRHGLVQRSESAALHGGLDRALEETGQA